MDKGSDKLHKALGPDSRQDHENSIYEQVLAYRHGLVAQGCVPRFVSEGCESSVQAGACSLTPK